MDVLNGLRGRARGRARATAALLLAAALLAAGCAGTRSVAHPEVDWSFYSRMGIVPFKTLAADRNAGEKVSSALLTELLMARTIEVAEPGGFVRALQEVLKGQSGGDPSALTAADLRRLGESAEVQAVLFGTVREYEMVRVGQEQFPLVSLDVRLVDAPTGALIWSGSVSRRGGPRLPFVSIGETHTLGELTQKVCEELAHDLARAAR